MELWHCGWELGIKAGSSGAHQDIWDSTHVTDGLEDADGGGDVAAGTGRYAEKLSPGGFGDYVMFKGHTFARGTNVIYWRIRAKLNGFAAPSELRIGDVFILCKLGESTKSGGTAGKLNIGYSITYATAPIKVMFSLMEGTMSKATWTTEIEVPSAWMWFVVKANASTGAIELFVDNVSRASYTTSPPSNVAYDPYLLPATMRTTGKAGDAGAKHIVDDCGANDETSPAPSSLVASADGAIIMFQPAHDVGSVSGWLGTKYPNEKWANVDDDQDACLPGNDEIYPANVGDRQAFTVPAFTGTAVWSVRILAENAALIHDFIARTTGGSFVQVTPTFGGSFGTGRQYQQTPEGSDWNIAFFNALEAGCHALYAGSGYNTKKFYISAIGQGIVRPQKNPCPFSAAFWPVMDDVDWLIWKRFRRGDALALARQSLADDDTGWMELFPPAPPPVVVGRRRTLLGVGS